MRLSAIKAIVLMPAIFLLSVQHNAAQTKQINISKVPIKSQGATKSATIQKSQTALDGKKGVRKEPEAAKAAPTPPAPPVAEAQANDSVLFTIGKDSIKKSEFVYVYNKNNTDTKTGATKATVDEYLELYINFRLKVKEAEEMGLDTMKSINSELESYRKQLAKSYLFDREVNERLLKEVYERLKNEVRASHVLVKIPEPGLPADTLEAYKKIMDLRKRIIKGESFDSIAKKYSDDPSAKSNNGDIGYFTALQTVYPFETVAYNTPVGQVSMPVRTKFGYHLVKVTNVRPAQGEITVAHILIKTPKDYTPEQLQNAKTKIEDIYKKATSGVPFDRLASEFSEDRSTKTKGGELPPFGTGKMVQEFETAAFALKNDGDISQPIRTEYGWHIIKRISKKELPPYDDIKGDLKKRVERDSRSEIAKNVLLEKIKKEYNFTEYPAAISELEKKAAPTITEPKFELKDTAGLNKPLFSVSGKNFTQQEFVNYLMDKQHKKRSESADKVYSDYYNQFVEDSLLNYEESQLDRKYPDFKALMKEYRDGILLFELTDRKVWSKAIKDTVGLEKFYEENKNKYMWDPRVEAEILTIKTDAKTLEKVRKDLAKKTTDEVISKYLKDKKHPASIKVDRGIYEKGQKELVDRTNWTLGLGPNIDNGDSTVTIVRVIRVVPPTPKSLSEAKGFIVSDYQEYLEKEWIKSLRAKYPVWVDKQVLSTINK